MTATESPNTLVYTVSVEIGDILRIGMMDEGVEHKDAGLGHVAQRA